MTDEKTFSHITVSADDDDDFVIQAGRRRSPQAQEPRAAVSTKKTVEESETLSDQDRSDSSTQKMVDERVESPEIVPEKASQATSKEDGYRATQLEDLKGAPMPTAQKVVIAVAALLVVGFAVYYIFLR